jgi:hypothetical protein
MSVSISNTGAAFWTPVKLTLIPVPYDSLTLNAEHELNLRPSFWKYQ